MTDYAAMMPFAQHLGVRIVSATKDDVVGTLDHAPERTTAGGGLHGGALMALADSVGAELRDASGRLVAQTTQTQAVLSG